jgi:uroporphyrin-III C-methyltransferase
LINPETLGLAARAILVPVGKRSGRYSTAQRFINKQLADAARRYPVVVRLKGGDPMLFGRASEEIAFLKRENIRVEVVPGVTAALAAGAELGISLTQRLVARSVVFATPRTAAGARASGWEKAIANADTAVLYMAAGEAQEVKAALISAGLRRQTPLVIAENVSLPSAAAFAGTLDELPKLAARLNGGPALIMLGEVCAELAVSSLISSKVLTAP